MCTLSNLLCKNLHFDKCDYCFTQNTFIKFSEFCLFYDMTGKLQISATNMKGAVT